MQLFSTGILCIGLALAEHFANPSVEFAFANPFGGGSSSSACCLLPTAFVFAFLTAAFAFDLRLCLCFCFCACCLVFAPAPAAFAFPATALLFAFASAQVMFFKEITQVVVLGAFKLVVASPDERVKVYAIQGPMYDRGQLPICDIHKAMRDNRTSNSTSAHTRFLL